MGIILSFWRTWSSDWETYANIDITPPQKGVSDINIEIIWIDPDIQISSTNDFFWDNGAGLGARFGIGIGTTNFLHQDSSPSYLRNLTYYNPSLPLVLRNSLHVYNTPQFSRQTYRAVLTGTYLDKDFCVKTRPFGEYHGDFGVTWPGFRVKFRDLDSNIEHIYQYYLDIIISSNLKFSLVNVSRFWQQWVNMSVLWNSRMIFTMESSEIPLDILFTQTVGD